LDKTLAHTESCFLLFCFLFDFFLKEEVNGFDDDCVDGEKDSETFTVNVEVVDATAWKTPKHLTLLKKERTVSALTNQDTSDTVLPLFNSVKCLGVFHASCINYFNIHSKSFKIFLPIYTIIIKTIDLLLEKKVKKKAKQEKTRFSMSKRFVQKKEYKKRLRMRRSNERS